MMNTKCSSTSSSPDNYRRFPRYSTDLLTVGRPPFVGDYMPYVGQDPTEGGYELESDVGATDYDEGNYYLNATLCQECMDNCVGLASIRGLTGSSLEKAKKMCKNKCNLECSPRGL